MPTVAEQFEVDLCPENEPARVVNLRLTWETASGGFLSGGDCRFYKVNMPARLFYDDGVVRSYHVFRQFCKQFADKLRKRLPTVSYRDNVYYRWTWD